MACDALFLPVTPPKWLLILRVRGWMAAHRVSRPVKGLSAGLREVVGPEKLKLQYPQNFAFLILGVFIRIHSAASLQYREYCMSKGKKKM
jgi:hypothetical protein